MIARSDRRDLTWAGILAASFLFGLAVSWERWGNPLIDCGREMNLPLRLARGEMLYSDVRHLYGPLSPYLHAALYRLFGPGLTVLYADGIVCAIAAIVLVYWLGRRIMPPRPAGAAALAVMWLCAFKPAGNYIFPYSYNALHGTVLGLLTLVLLVWALATQARTAFAIAGLGAGLALAAKTEMGLAALTAGIVAAVVSGYPAARRTSGHVAAFLFPALGLAAAIYAWFAAEIGWKALADDNFLFLYNVPAGLAHYNAWISGFDHPLRSVGRMLLAAVKLGTLAAVLAAISLVVTRRRMGSPAGASPLRLIAGAAVLLLLLAFTTGLDWDKGPYLAMPLVLGGLLAAVVPRLRHGLAQDTITRLKTRTLVVFAAYALASLARMMLHVRSGGAYGSYLLPLSVVLFTYVWHEPFGDWLERRGSGRLGASIAVWLIIADAVATGGLLAYRYRTRYQTEIRTSRGTMVAEQDVGQAWREAIHFIATRTAPAAPVAVLPEGTSLDFLTDRRNPLREEITTPGLIEGRFEWEAIARLAASRAPLVLLTNRPTSEFGAPVFGRDYAVALMRWVEEHYDLCAVFGPVKRPGLQIGDRPFFIRAYCRCP